MHNFLCNGYIAFCGPSLLCHLTKKQSLRRLKSLVYSMHAFIHYFFLLGFQQFTCYLLVVVQSKQSVVVAEKKRCNFFNQQNLVLRQTQLQSFHGGSSKAPVFCEVTGQSSQQTELDKPDTSASQMLLQTSHGQTPVFVVSLWFYKKYKPCNFRI